MAGQTDVTHLTPGLMRSSVAALSAPNNAARKEQSEADAVLFFAPIRRSVVAPFRTHWSARDVPRRHRRRQPLTEHSIQLADKVCRGCISALRRGWRGGRGSLLVRPFNICTYTAGHTWWINLRHNQFYGRTLRQKTINATPSLLKGQLIYLCTEK